MPKFRQTETSSCKVTWIAEVEANDIEEARALFDSGIGTYSGPEYGEATGETKTVVVQIKD
jgi:hypothetical protein